MKELQVRNRQRERRVDTRQLRAVTVQLLENLLGVTGYELGIHLISPRAMAEVNQRYLQHAGPTDVITFDLKEAGGMERLEGEIYICVAVAETQAKEFRTTWQGELVRYVVHGVLHLRGYDDLEPAKRQRMKREENRLVKALARQFSFRELAR